MQYKDYSRCICGAITLETDSGIYHVQDKMKKIYFHDLDLRSVPRMLKQQTYCCDACVNHYGVDLCGCGSGEPFGKCSNDLEACQYPMQKVGEYTQITQNWFSGELIFT